MDYFAHLDPLLRMYWFVAIPASAVFVIQTILTFVGLDSAHHIDFVDADSHGDADFQIFSLRNLINFLLGISWSGISFYDIIPNSIVLVIISCCMGCAFVYAFFLIITQIQKLAEDNSFRFADALNKTAEVYVPIPAQLSGKGKVVVSVKGSVHELEAITNQGSIATGSIVKVVGIEGNLLIVEKAE